jgi:hypothetical protein
MTTGLRLAVAAALVAALGAGCGRVETLSHRLADLPDAVRRPLSDTLWETGSLFAWAGHRTMRCEITRTTHQPIGDVVSHEVWRLDLESGHFRIDKPELTQTVAFDGLGWHITWNGKETDNLEMRAAAAGDAMIIRQIMTMPFGLLDPGLKLEYVGTRTGPAEARQWDVLLATCQGALGAGAEDRLAVEINKTTHRVDGAAIRWQEPPFLGQGWRVALDEWRPVDGIKVAHRWRFWPTDDKGAAGGPPRYTFTVTAVAWDVN